MAPLDYFVRVGPVVGWIHLWITLLLDDGGFEMFEMETYRLIVMRNVTVWFGLG